MFLANSRDNAVPYVRLLAMLSHENMSNSK